MERDETTPEQQQLRYKYTALPSLVWTALLLPFYIIGIKSIGHVSRVSFYIYLFGFPYLMAVNIRALLRLGDSITLTDAGIVKTAFFRKPVRIPWDQVIDLKVRVSILERSCLIVRSHNGAKISIAEWINDFHELYVRLKQRTSDNKQQG